MNKDFMISKIYEVIADKTLTNGCRYISKLDGYIYIYRGEWEDNYPYGAGLARDGEEILIGHPVMIGDVLDWISDNIPDHEDKNMIFNYRKTFRKPIEEQDTECILFIYNLIEGQEKKNYNK